MQPPQPIFKKLPAGSNLVRLYNPMRFAQTAVTFRQYGPVLRFDHHRSSSETPTDDPDRGIYYASLTLSGCIVEIFGDAGEIDTGEWHVARPEAVRPFKLLKLTGIGAMRAGSVAALAKAPDHAVGQAWSRYFYETAAYQNCDGILYANANNDEPAVALYERAADALSCPASSVIRLDAPGLRAELLAIARRHRLICLP